MQVNLVNFTPNPDLTVYKAAKICYSEDFVSDEKQVAEKEVARLLKHLSSAGHMSVFEHVTFTFAISEISRVTTHQLVRHRIASYSQQSQRYVSSSNGSITVPISIVKVPKIAKEYIDFYKKSLEFYDRMVAEGIPKEDARYILPHGMNTKITVSMNGRALMEFFTKRLCQRAQWEIRECAEKMLDLVEKAAPLTFSLAGPHCRRGICYESHPCDWFSVWNSKT